MKNTLLCNLIKRAKPGVGLTIEGGDTYILINGDEKLKIVSNPTRAFVLNDGKWGSATNADFDKFIKSEA